MRTSRSAREGFDAISFRLAPMSNPSSHMLAYAHAGEMPATYAYAGNNPLAFIDPNAWGLDSYSACVEQLGPEACGGSPPGPGQTVQPDPPPQPPNPTPPGPGCRATVAAAIAVCQKHCSGASKAACLGAAVAAFIGCVALHG